MRKNQVSILIDRFGDQVPKNYSKDTQHVHVYADSNNVYEALSKAYCEAINLLGEYEDIPSFGRCDCTTNLDDTFYGNLLGKKAEISEHYDRRAKDLKDIVFSIEHSEEILKVVRESEDKDEARKNIMKCFNRTEQQANNILRLRWSLFTKQEVTEIREDLDKCLKIISERESRFTEDMK